MGSQPAGQKRGIGCRYFRQALAYLLYSQLLIVTAPWSVPNYTAWRQRRMRVKNFLSRFMTLKRLGPFGGDCRRGEAVALTITPPRCTSPFTALCSSDYACVTNNIDNNHPSALCNTTTYLTYVIVPLDTL